jgi:hypothetical protein
VAKARELRDRYLEHVNGERLNGGAFALESKGRYDVARALPDACQSVATPPVPLLLAS